LEEITEMHLADLERHDALRLVVSKQESLLPASISRVKEEVLTEARDLQRHTISNLSSTLREREEAFEAQVRELYEKTARSVNDTARSLLDSHVAELKAEEHKNKHKLMAYVEQKLAASGFGKEVDREYNTNNIKSGTRILMSASEDEANATQHGGDEAGAWHASAYLAKMERARQEREFTRVEANLRAGREDHRRAGESYVD